jgi:transcriptional regulator with GAF, ATPase, and Fis domain
VDVIREQRLAETFVELADTLVADFDVVEFLHALANRCVELLGVQAAGLMLADQRGELRLVGASSEQARLLELFELEADQGPCVACYQAGTPVAETDLDPADARWPGFAARAQATGFRAVHALPLRLRSEVIGVLNLFSTAPGPLDRRNIRIGQAMADVATIGLLQQRAIRERQVLAEQLQGALNSRVLIEQAKGVLAERMGVDMDSAFRWLRDHARQRNRRLTEIAEDVITGRLGAGQLS